jgi:hypothetical protein
VRLARELGSREPTGERYLASLQTDPMLRVLLAAPLDDEPTTPEQNEGAALAHDEIRRGEFLTADEPKRAPLG